DLITGALIGDQRQDQPAPKALNFGVGTAALVYDTSIFGGTSPVLGQSYRFQAGINAGSIDFSTVLLDYRKYLSLARPVSLAGRLLHFGRYGGGADDPRLQPLFLGYPSIVRGYEFNSFSASECGAQFQATGACPAFDRLLGTKIASGSLEVRFELLGALGILRTPQIPPVELAPFFDTGVAWTALDKPDFLGGNRRLVSSEGLTLRVNALGFAVVAIDYAIPNNRTRSHIWEFTFLPGY
ncbi:MAG: BamA/TamA family outer membrane protein, partial [Terriglobales bacterium]